MKINSIIKVEKKVCDECNGIGTIIDIMGDKVDCPRCCLVFPFNRGQDLIGNKEIGLDVGKIEEIMNKTYQESDKNRPLNFLDYAKSLKDQEKLIIVEVNKK